MMRAWGIVAACLACGTAHADKQTVTGTGAADVIDVSASNVPHDIFARGGSDTVSGSQAADYIEGGSGGDTLNGNGGDDVLVGGTGNDRLSGGGGNDRMSFHGTNNGFDTIDGGAGHDRIEGSAQDDVIGLNGPLVGVEVIDGGAGHDTIQLSNTVGLVVSLAGISIVNVERVRGGRKSDRITGSANDDLIEGGGGNDSIDGGPGRDTAVYAGEFARYRILGTPGAWTVTDLVGTDGSDSLNSIELLRFADGVWDGSTFTPAFPANAVPNARADRATTDEDVAIVINVLANDTDPDGDALVVESVTPATKGTLTIRSDQTILYAPHADVNGADSFTYQLRDARFARASAAVTVTVRSVPDVPRARPDQGEAFPGQAALLDVLANDSDPDGDPLQIVSVGNSAASALVEIVGNRVRYTPAAGASGTDRFTYTVEDPSGRRGNAAVDVTVYGARTGEALRVALAAAPEGSWLRVNRNRFSDVWTPSAQRPNGAFNPARIISAWASMAWDSRRLKLMFWGGGHKNYSGNEVYRFDTSTLLWERASLPSAIYNPLGNQEWFAVDGPLNAPIAAHTYDNQEYLPNVDRFVTFGGGKFNSDAFFVLLDGQTPTGPYFWDPGRADRNAVGGTTGSQVNPAVFNDVIGHRMWENRDTLVTRGIGPARPVKFVNGTTDYVPFGGKDALLLTETPAGGGRLFRYIVHDIADPARDEWLVVGIRGDGYGNQGAGAYDPDRQLYVRSANTPAGLALVVWNLATAGPANRSFNVLPVDPTGQFSLNREQGLDYDARRKVFVLWDGSPEVWAIRPPGPGGIGNWLVEKLPVPATGELPAKADGALETGSIDTVNGVLGKWKYSPEFDAYFGALNPERGDIWVYKPANWQPQ